MTSFRALAVVLALCACASLPPGPSVPDSEATQAHAALALASLSVRAVDDLAAFWWASIRARLPLDLEAYEAVTGAVSEARVELRAAALEIERGKPAGPRFGKINALMHGACVELTRLGARPSAELTHALAVVRAYAKRN